jgi:uncharacterized protein GlcG (DUF336 family)
MGTCAGLMTTRPTLSRAHARRLVDAAAREAEAISVAVTIVAVDESGVLTRSAAACPSSQMGRWPGQSAWRAR